MERETGKKWLMLLCIAVIGVTSIAAQANLKTVYYSSPNWNVRDTLAGDFTAIAEFPPANLYSGCRRVWYARENDLGVEYYKYNTWNTRSGIVTNKTYTTLAGSPVADQVFAGNDSGALDRITWNG